MTLTQDHLLMVASAMAACLFIAMLIAIWRGSRSARANVLAREEGIGLEKELAEVRRQLQTANAQSLAEKSRFEAQGRTLAEAMERSTTYKTRAEESRARIEELQQRLNDMETNRDQLQQEKASLGAEFAELKTSLDEREKSYQSQLAQLNAQEEKLTEHFKLLANEILEAKTRAMQETNKASLSTIMAPFQQSIDGFKKEVQDIHHRESSQRGELKKELETLKELNQKITTEAHELSTALRGQKKLQGNWGELVLENVLDRSGLQLGKDYKREVSITTEDGKLRPDAVVYLPQDKHLIIDSKVSLAAYTRYINSEDDTERRLALEEHVRAMSQRIVELSRKDYYKLPGLNSPEIVFMFVPIESAFVEALKADEELFQSAIENNVLVATPTTLLTSLNIVRQLWRYEDQNKHTAALAEKAERVFKKLNAFLESFEGIKRGLDRAVESYGKAEGQLVSGRGNLVKQVGEFKNLAPAIKAELPDYFTEKADLEVDFVPHLQPEKDADDGSQ